MSARGCRGGPLTLNVAKFQTRYVRTPAISKKSAASRTLYHVGLALANEDSRRKLFLIYMSALSRERTRKYRPGRRSFINQNEIRSIQFWQTTRQRVRKEGSFYLVPHMNDEIQPLTW